MSAIKNAIIKDAKDAIIKNELKIRVLQKIIDSISAAGTLDEWLHNAEITGITGIAGVRLLTSKWYLSALIDGDDNFFVSVKVSSSKDGMIDYANKEINNCLQVIEYNNERLANAEHIAERVASHVKNIKKELIGLNELSFEHRLILSLVARDRKIL